MKTTKKKSLEKISEKLVISNQQKHLVGGRLPNDPKCYTPEGFVTDY